MGERNFTTGPLGPAGTSYYVLNTQVLIESNPLHFLVSKIDQSGQCIGPLLPSNTNFSIKTPGERIVCNSTNGQKTESKVTKPGTSLIVLSNELITPIHRYTSLTSSIHDKNLKDIDTDTLNAPKQEDVLKKYKNKEESNYVQNYVHIPDRVVPPRAVAVLPTALQMRRDSIYPTRLLPPRVRFGPVQGVITKIFPAEADELVYESAVNKQPIFLMKRDKDIVTHINASDKEKSNWLSLLPLGNKDTANVWLYEEDEHLYGITTKLIPCRTALSLGYSKKYVEDHKLFPDQPVLDLEEALAEQSQWWCFECRRSFRSSSLLLRHTNLCHEEYRPPRRKFRCSYCSRAFCRMFTLRRHTKICEKKYMKPPAASETVQKKRDPEICNAQVPDDNKIPSDESFLNYTSALDFSTNLFDPDRIYNLDISGSSKSEAELNLNSTASRFENFDNNEDYSKFCKGIQAKNDDKIGSLLASPRLSNITRPTICSIPSLDSNEKTKQKEFMIVTCTYCEQTMTKTAKRRHLRECPARRLECECGKVFTRKDVFAKHVHLNHNNTGLEDNEVKTESQKNETEMLPYKCEACKMKFKRRGMLINHLWRVHKTTSVEVPLERRVRHYPCSICPKIYKTAAKRDRHVRTHHPGASVRAAPIEGERRFYQPAKCSACPREYMTHSKLLQHIRARHPELALPTKDDAKRSLKPKPQNKLQSRKKVSQKYY